MKYQKEIAQNNLRASRENMGLTQAQVAAVIGCRQESLERWEKGTSVPPTDTLFRLCALYKTPLEQVYDKLRERLIGELQKWEKQLQKLER